MAAWIMAFGFVLLPAAVLYLCHRSPVADKIGAAAWCYLLGILISLSGLTSPGLRSVQDVLMTVTVPLAIPLMLFSMDLKRWLRLAGPTLLSIGFMMLAVTIASLAGFLLMRHRLEEPWKVAGMMVGVYTGGTPNLNAIGLALKVKEHMLILANSADMLLGVPWFLFMLTLAPRLFRAILPPFPVRTDGPDPTSEDPSSEACNRERLDVSCYSGVFQRSKRLPLLKALGLSGLIFAAATGLYLIAPPAYNMAVLMLSITTLGLACSFIPAVRNIDLTFQAGQYLILVFCLVIGSSADLRQLFTAAPAVLAFTFIVMYGAWLIHVGLALVFRIDADTVIITSVGAIFSPPFVPAAAAALKNREVVFSGLAAGLIGYAVGNYLGVSWAHLLRICFSG